FSTGRNCEAQERFRLDGKLWNLFSNDGKIEPAADWVSGGPGRPAAGDLSRKRSRSRRFRRSDRETTGGPDGCRRPPRQPSAESDGPHVDGRHARWGPLAIGANVDRAPRLPYRPRSRAASRRTRPTPGLPL